MTGTAKTLTPAQYCLLGVTTFLVIGLVGILLYPKCITGDYCELKIIAIQIGSEGDVSIDLVGKASSGTSLGSRWTQDGITKGRGRSEGWAFPAWPHEIGRSEKFSLASSAERKSGISDSAELRKRILIEKGQKYLLRDHERLVLYRRVNPDGSTDEYYIEVNPR